ncbi:MAG: glucosaminidase domain-containing protein [Chloroflexota bacterium]|nr:glucosaminidase domain-containing protein [Chloroflexota bacterium]
MFQASNRIRGKSSGKVDDVLALVEARGPARADAVEAYLREVYRLGGRVGINADIVAVQAIHETDWFRSKWWKERLNPAGIGITGDPAQDKASRTWETGEDAARAHLVHLWLYAEGETLHEALEPFRKLDPRWDAAVAAGKVGKTKTIAALAGTWAADQDYAEKIVRHLNAIFPDAPTPQPAPPSDESLDAVGRALQKRVILLNMGHRHTIKPGGAKREYDWTPGAVWAAEKALSKRGYTVLVNQRDDGGSDHELIAGSLDKIGQNAVQLDRARGPIFLYISFHYDSARAPGFHIIPASANNLTFSRTGQKHPDDTLENNALDLLFSRIMAKRMRTEIPDMGLRKVWGWDEPGIMPEFRTGVAEGGWRLSEMGETKPLRDHAVRVVMEAGSYGWESNRELLWSNGFRDQYAEVLADAVDQFHEQAFKTRGQGLPPPPAPVPPATTFAEPVPIPELKPLFLRNGQSAPEKAAVVHNGVEYIAVNDLVEAVVDTKRLQFAHAGAKEVGPEIPAGYRFSAGAIFRSPDDGERYALTPYWTRVRWDDLRVVADRPDEE